MTTFSRTFELRWSDADANGHVRHTVYAELGVEARMAFLRESGFDWRWFEKAGLGPVLLKEEVHYLREIALGETVTVDLQVAGASPDGARWVFRHKVMKPGGDVAARLVVSGGWIDTAARKLAVPPADLAAFMNGAPRSDDFQVLPPLRR